MRYLLPDDVAFYACALAARAGMEAEVIGEVDGGRRMWVLRVGRGALQMAVKGNAHADEPSGTVTCFHFARWLAEHPAGRRLAERITFHLLPTAHPRGLERNRGWLGTEIPDLPTWFLHARRDPPPEDREFGYGEMPAQAAHPECAAWHAYLRRLPRLDGYVSLHSMAFAGGAWFLALLDDLERRRPLLDALTQAAQRRSLPLHDEDRGGRKGFWRIGPGFHTAPTREGMKAFFAASEHDEARNWLRFNSMQVARMCHGTPVALVSELPLWWDPELADMTPACEQRRSLDARAAEGLLQAAEELEAICRAVQEEAVAPTATSQPAWLKELQTARQTAAHLRSGAQAQQRLAPEWGDRPATRRDLAAAELHLLHARALNAAIALRLLAAAGRPPEERWVVAVLERAERIERRFDLRPLPLSQQVDLQVAMLTTLAEHLL